MWPAFTTPCIGCDLPHCWQRYSKPEIDARKRYRDIRSVVTQDVGYHNENHCTPRSSVLRSRGFHDENLSDLHATKEGLVFGIRRNCPLFVISDATRASPIFHVAASFIISFYRESSMSASHQRTPAKLLPVTSQAFLATCLDRCSVGWLLRADFPTFLPAWNNHSLYDRCMVIPDVLYYSALRDCLGDGCLYY